jgi:hypothetical protein
MEVNFSKRSIVRRTGSTESPGNVGFLSTVAADELRVLLQRGNFFRFARLGKFADMQLVIVRIGAEIADIDKSSAHGDIPLVEPWKFIFILF